MMVLGPLLLSGSVWASHAMGVDINYAYVAPNQYLLTVNFYRDCVGINAPNSLSIDINAVSCSASGSVTVFLTGPGTEVSPLCPAQLANSTCSGGSLPGVEKYEYKGYVFLPAKCTDWTFSWDHCCRNAAITNLASPSTQNMYVETVLNNTGNLNNSAPVFTTLPVPYICLGQTFCYNHGAYDPDGDSLAYSLISAKTINGANIAYVNPNSATYPMTTSSGSVTFDPLTGSMCVLPSVAQMCVITILVEEYRAGVKIGSTMRDLQIVVQNCTNVQPHDSSGGIINISGGTALDTNSIEVCPGSTVSFDVVYKDNNAGDSIFLSSNIGTTIPGATLTTSGVNSITMSFSWTPTPFDTGFHQFTAIIQDNGCPILGSQVFAFDIWVHDGIYAGPDTAYCQAGNPTQLSAVGGNSFTWNILSGDPSSLSCTNCKSPLASPNQTTTYEVVSNLSASCKNKDTVTVTLAPNFTLNAGPDDTICKFNFTTLSASATPGSQGPFTFNWSPSADLSSDSITNPVANPWATADYILTATSNAGCVLQDSVKIVVDGVAPIVTTSDNDTLCPGSSANLSTIVATECDTTSIACTGSTNSGVAGNGTWTTTSFSTHYMTGAGFSNRRQFLITKDELEAMGFIGGGKITAIGIAYSSANNTNTDITIKMGCTSITSFPNTAFVNGLQVVKNSFSHTPSVGYNMWALDNDYMWDGISNLIVEFCTDAVQTGSHSSVYYGCYSIYNCIYSNNSGTAGGCSDSSGTRTSCRPNIAFNWCEATPAGATYSWNPAATLDNSSVSNPTATPNGTTSYIVTVSDGNCSGVDTVTIAYDSSNYVTVGVAPTNACAGDTVQLSASVVGSPASQPLSCGTNGTTCSTSNHTETVGTGSSTSATYGPFYATSANQRYGNKFQMILTPAELNSAGITTTGTISQLAFNVGSSGGEKFKEIVIKMGCTTSSTYSGSSFITSGLTTVYSNVNQYTVTNGWNTWNITPYDWDGTSNLVIEMCAQTFSGNTDPETVEYTAVGANRFMYRHDACNCSACNQSTGTASTSRPNIRLTICDSPSGAFAYSWTPGTNLSSTTVASPMANGVTPGITYSVTVTGGVCTVSDSITLNGCGPLDASDIEFTATQVGGKVELKWVTFGNKKFESFKVLRSEDAIEYSALGNSVDAANGKYSYQDIDWSPQRGKNYYRLKALDANREYWLSNEIEIDFSPATIHRVYPNPVEKGDAITVSFGDKASGVVMVTLTDLLGRIIERKVVRDVSSVGFETGSLGAGSYLVDIRGISVEKASIQLVIIE